MPQKCTLEVEHHHQRQPKPLILRDYWQSSKRVGEEQEGMLLGCLTYSGSVPSSAHSTLESTRLNDISLRCKSRLPIVNDGPWRGTVVPLAFDRSALKLAQAYKLRSNSTTKIRGSNANNLTDVCDFTLLLADSLHNRPELCLRRYTDKSYSSSIPTLCSTSKLQRYTEGSPLSSKCEPTMLLLSVYKVEDNHNHQRHSAIQDPTANANYKLGTSILQYSSTMTSHAHSSVLARSNHQYANTPKQIITPELPQSRP
ncbi:hypothetical protein EAE96_008762 [Botrytis aclada]|nr:hypothetical protein EAE96_008762 [Botrytis aclada]